MLKKGKRSVTERVIEEIEKLFESDDPKLRIRALNMVLRYSPKIRELESELIEAVRSLEVKRK